MYVGRGKSFGTNGFLRIGVNYANIGTRKVSFSYSIGT